jgi:fumarate hydratase class II
VNAELGVLPQDMAQAIQDAAAEVARGDYDGHFPVDVFQTGSGTSSNMNTNEVLATLATEKLGEPVHPNDHVNASQSSNDVFPSSIHIAATSAVVNELVPALEHLASSLERKSEEFATVVKAGRTHLMDATPVTLGQEFGGYASQVRYGVERLQACLPRLAELPLGGTAVGTGINTPPGFSARVIEEVASATGLRSPRRATTSRRRERGRTGRGQRAAAHDRRQPQQDLQRPAVDGLRPARRARRDPAARPAARQLDHARQGEPGDPGGDAHGVRAGHRQRRRHRLRRRRGNFELNVMLPVMARNLLESIRLVANVSRLLADRTVDGIVADVERCRELAESSPSIVTPLNKYLGYENAAKVAKTALKERKTIREVVLESGFVDDGTLTEQQLDTALDVLSMTRPPRPDRPRSHPSPQREGRDRTDDRAQHPVTRHNGRATVSSRVG